MRPSVRALLLAAPLLTGCVTAGCPAPRPQGDTDVTLVCDQDYLPAVEALAAGAQQTLHITQFELFTGSATSVVVTALADAADRGVEVRVLLDDEIEDNAGAVEALLDRGVDARLDDVPDTTLHAKMLVADGSVALVGSTNWSNSSIARNQECNLRLDGGSPVAWLQAYVDAVWADPEPRVAPTVDQSDAPRVQALGDDTLLPSLLELLDGAEDRVDFTLYATFLQPDNPSSETMQVFQALADAADRGVTVRGVAEWSDWQTDNNVRNTAAVQWLEERGVQMRWEQPDVITHAKTFLVDDTLQVQSANVSVSGFARNHETGARTDLDEPVAAYVGWFGELWELSTEEPVE